MNDSDLPQPEPKAAPFGAFRTFARKLLSAPKAVIDKRDAEYQRQQARKPKRGPKPVPK